jgi:hypothetical protein
MNRWPRHKSSNNDALLAKWGFGMPYNQVQLRLLRECEVNGYHASTSNPYDDKRIEVSTPKSKQQAPINVCTSCIRCTSDTGQVAVSESPETTLITAWTVAHRATSLARTVVHCNKPPMPAFHACHQRSPRHTSVLH